MDLVTLYTIVGFSLASYSVIANDSVQTLGTWMASNQARFKWYYMWAPLVLFCYSQFGMVGISTQVIYRMAD